MRRLITILALVPGLAMPSTALASPMSWALRPTVARDDAPGASEPTETDAEDPALVEAKQAFEAGSREYKLGNYEQAVALFERSYELSERPALLFNIAQAYARKYEIDDDVENLRKAKKLYANFIVDMEAAGELDPEAKADAERLSAEVDAQIEAHEQRVRTSGRGKSRDRDDRPLVKKGWFWAVVVGGAAAVAGGVTAAVLLSRDEAFDPELGRVSGGDAPDGGGFRVHF